MFFFRVLCAWVMLSTTDGLPSSGKAISVFVGCLHSTCYRDGFSSSSYCYRPYFFVSPAVSVVLMSRSLAASTRR